MRTIVFFAVTALAAAPSVGAQTAASPSAGSVAYTVAGMVTGLDAAGVAKAEISFNDAGGAGHRVQSDSAGRFSISGLSSPTIVLRIRAFGYTPKAQTVNVTAADHRAVVTISLEPLAAELTGAEVTAAGADADTKLIDYYSRKTANNNFGRYVDGADIEKRKPQFVSEMLRNMPGVSLEGGTRIGNTLRIRGCAPLVWVDGVRMPGAQLDDVAAPQDVAGIEVYNSFAGIPARYFDRSATCGTILVWLRS